MRRWVLIGVFVAVCGLLVGVFGLAFGRNPRDVPFGMKGKPAPAFTLRDLTTDEPVSLSDFAGKPVVINFWASWCGPCKQEHPNLEWAARAYRDQVVFLGMIFEDTPENARGFLARHGAGYPHLIDPNSLTAVKYGAAGVPETYFITREGAILDKYAGPIPRGVLAERLQQLLAVGAAPASPTTARGSP
jgi:cytochrome c biogenesis protein CcmG/thiol:disulfide interchange protein DsbE